MRREPTISESRVWTWLRDRRFCGFKFRRQHPIAGYILDFYCAELKLAIELDGKHHELQQDEYDEERTRRLNALGINVLRIPNELLARDPITAEDIIRAACESPSPGLRPPSPRDAGRGHT